MRKHNTKFATRWSREAGDRSNFPQATAHAFVNSKAAQFAANGVLQNLLLRAGCLRPAPGTPEASEILAMPPLDFATPHQLGIGKSIIGGLRRFFS